MSDQPINDRTSPKPLRPWKPQIPFSITFVVFGVFLGLLGGLHNPDDVIGWKEHFRYGRAATAVCGLLATLAGAAMGWNVSGLMGQSRLRGLILGGAGFGLVMLIGLLILTYSPYGFSIIVGYLLGGSGKFWSEVLGTVFGAAFGFTLSLVPLVVPMSKGTTRISLLAEYIGNNAKKTVYLRLFRRGAFRMEQYIRGQAGERTVAGLSAMGRWERHNSGLLLFLYQDDSALFEVVSGMEPETFVQSKGFVNYEGTEFSLANIELKRK